MIRNLVTTGLASVIMGMLVLSHTLVTPPRPQRSKIDATTAIRVGSPDDPNVAVAARLSTGGEASTLPETESTLSQQGLMLFREQIRPLFVGTCLKCHDSDKRSGGLDLTRRATALAGGDSGEAIVAGKPTESLLYQLVTAGEMPRETNALLPQQIAAIKRWIELGALYEGAPLAYAGEPSVVTTGANEGGVAETGGMMMCPCMKMTTGQGMMHSPTNKPGITALLPSSPVTKGQAKKRGEHYLKSLGNPNLKTGKVNETISSYEIQVVTKDNSLANWIIVDRETGQMRLLY